MNSELSEGQAADDEMLPEYDLSGGVRGKQSLPARLPGHHPQDGQYDRGARFCTSRGLRYPCT